MDKLEQKLTQKIAESCVKAKLECGLDTAFVEKQLEQKGAVFMLKNFSKKGMVSPLFDQLKEKNRLDLSPEAIASKGEYAALFTDAEADWFLQVLCEAEYF